MIVNLRSDISSFIVLIPAGGRAPGAKLEMASRELDIRAPVLEELFSGAIRGRFDAAIDRDVNGECPYSDPEAS